MVTDICRRPFEWKGFSQERFKLKQCLLFYALIHKCPYWTRLYIIVNVLNKYVYFMWNKKEINIDLLVFQLLIDMSKNKLGNKLSKEIKNRIDCLYLGNFLLSLFPHIWQRSLSCCWFGKKYFLSWKLHMNKEILE